MRRTEFLTTERLGIGIQAEENSTVDERVLFLRPRAFVVFGVGGANDSLNLCAVDETADIRV